MPIIVQFLPLKSLSFAVKKENQGNNHSYVTNGNLCTIAAIPQSNYPDTNILQNQ